MFQSKKSNQWNFGMEVHIGVDSQTGLIHSANVTPRMCTQPGAPNLLDGDERADSTAIALTGVRINGNFSKPSHPTRGTLPISVSTGIDPLIDADKETNRKKTSVRSKVEHLFQTIKYLWVFTKERYRGLAKSADIAFVMLALINLTK